MGWYAEAKKKAKEIYTDLVGGGNEGGGNEPPSGTAGGKSGDMDGNVNSQKTYKPVADVADIKPPEIKKVEQPIVSLEPPVFDEKSALAKARLEERAKLREQRRASPARSQSVLTQRTQLPSVLG